MRKIKLTIIVITLLTSAVMLSAQPLQLREFNIYQMASMMRDALNLSYSQTIHIQNILTDIGAQVEATQPDHLANPEIVRTDADNFRLAADEKIKSVLNKLQKSKYDQIKSSLFKGTLKHSRSYQM